MTTAERLADKYILADGSDPPPPTSSDDMSDAEYHALREKYLLEKARREHNTAYPKELGFRSFCARVRHEFTDRLAPSQRETIERVYGAPPPPTLDAHLELVCDTLRKVDWDYSGVGGWRWLRPRHSHRGFSSKDYGYVRIWRRVRDDWGSVEPNSFEHELEQAHQHDMERRQLEIDELRKRLAKPQRDQGIDASEEDKLC
jgi:hypothetical protein